MKNKSTAKEKSVQDIQDDIFRKMSVAKKIEIGCDFSMYGLKKGLKDGAPIPTWYLKKWLKINLPSFYRKYY